MSTVLEAREPKPRWLEQVSARWREVLEDPSLRDLPYKVETNRGGQLIMSPAKNVHAFYQGRVAALLERALGGYVFAECSIGTPEGVKVPDVAWCSNDYLSTYGVVDPYAVAPELCVEIKSPSNAESELQAKVRLYLDAGGPRGLARRREGRCPRARARRRDDEVGLRGRRGRHRVRSEEGLTMNRIARRFALILAWAFALATGIAMAQDAKPGDDFLRLVDTKKYAESWDVASAFFKQSVSRTDWTDQVVRARDPLGDVASRTLKTSVPQKDPAGAPPGEYLLQTYETVFASQGAPRTETLALVREADGRWRTVGYFIR